MIRLAKVAAVLVALLVGGGVLGGAWLLRSAGAREWVRGVAERRATALFDGRATLTIGGVRSLSPSALVLERVEVRDRWRQPVLRVGTVRARLDLRALTGRVVHLRHLALDDVELAVVQRLDSVWNVASLLADSAAPRSGPPGWGDDVRADTIVVRRMSTVVSALWEPHRTFRGTERDSVLAVYRTLHAVRDTAGRHVVTRRFDRLGALATDVRLVRPEGGGRLSLLRLATRMSDPALAVREARGTLEWTPDKMLRVALDRVVAGASVASVRGTIGWREPGPVRYDLAVAADTVALADIGWVWPALPPSGGGRVRLGVRSAADADIVDYALDSLVLASEGSVVSGRVTVRVTPRDLALSRLRLEFAPLTAAVWRRLLDAPPPAALDGAIRGTLVAEIGGPLAGVRVDDARFTYADGRSPVATLHFDGLVGRGLGVVARDVRVRRLELPLALVRPFAATWPAGLAGTLSATGVVSADGARASVDARDLVLTLRAPDGRTGTVTGRVRAVVPPRGAGLVDVALATAGFPPVLLGALADSLPVRTPIVARLAARGTLDDATVALALGAVTDSVPLLVDGRVRRSADAVAFEGTTRAWRADLHALTGDSALPRTAISGAVTLAVEARRTRDGWRLAGGRGAGGLAQDSLSGLVPIALEGEVGLDSVALDVAGLALTAPGLRAAGVGRLARAGAGERMPSESPALTLVARADRLDAVRAALARLADAWPAPAAVPAALQALPDTVEGELAAEVTVRGALATPVADVRLDGRGLAAGAMRAEAMEVRGTLGWPLAGTLTASLRDVGAGAVRFDTVTVQVDSLHPGRARLALRASGRDVPAIRAVAEVALAGDTARVQLDSLAVDDEVARLALRRPARAWRTPDAIVLDTLSLAVGARGRVDVAATLPERGAVRGSLHVVELPLAGLAAVLPTARGIGGTLGARVTLDGTRDAPVLDWTVRGDSVGRGALVIPHVEGDGGYADRELFGSFLVDARRRDDAVGTVPRAPIRGSIALPVDLAFRGRAARLLDRPLAMRVDIDSLALAELPLDLASARQLGGTADGHLLVRGTPRAPTLAGALALRDGRVALPAAGIELRSVALDLHGEGREVVLDRLRMTSGPRAGDSLSVRGRMRFGDGATDRGAVALDAILRRFEVLRRPDLADLTLGGTIRATGPLDSVAVTADLVVDRGTIYRDAVEARQTLDLTSPRALELLGRDAPALAERSGVDLAALRGRLRSSRIRIAAGEELWVRAPSVAAKVGGEVTLIVDRGALVPTGELTAQRGLYRLDLGVVRRTFDVDSGRVRFYGAEQLPPSVDVHASHVVRQANGGEVTVRAHITGTLERPALRLSTDDAPGGTVPETEVISLLLFGAPTFALDGTSRGTVQSVTSVLLPSVGGVVEGALGRLLPVFNTVQLTTAGGTDQSLARVDLLSNLAVSAGKQIGDRTFLRLNSGICRGTADATRDLSPWLGLAVEYRLSPTLSVQVSADPGTAPCSRAGADQVARLQFGFDLFHSWIF